MPRSLRHSMPGAGILRRSRLLLYVGRMEGFGVQGMPCTCDLGRAEEPQQAAPSLRHSMPGAGTLSVESPWLAMEFIAGSRLH
jgi:hypothetical protein